MAATGRGHGDPADDLPTLDEFDANVDPARTVVGTGDGGLLTPTVEGRVMDAPATITMLAATDASVPLLAKVHGEDDTSIGTMISLKPEQAEELAELLLECASGARQNRRWDE
jgi:hypothetical protein